MIKSIRLSKGLRALAVTGIMAAPMALVATPALAGTTSPQTDTFQVTAKVTNSCSVTAGNTLAFGNYDPLAPIGATNGQGTTTFTVECSNGTNYAVGLNYGNGTKASKTDRFMTGGTSGTDLLAYNLYTNSSHSNVWYDGADGCNTVPNSSTDCQAGTGNGKSGTSYTVFGQIDQAATPTPSAGSYTDTITVDVYF